MADNVRSTYVDYRAHQAPKPYTDWHLIKDRVLIGSLW